MISAFKNIAKSKGYKIYTDPFKLNIWGIRSKASTPNRFDDTLSVFYNSSETERIQWRKHSFKITTDPSTYWLTNPIKPRGTAILAQGQYENAYKVDLHRGKYYALCQRLEKVKIIVDYNKDNVLDFKNTRTQTGMFGINIHRARKLGVTYEIDNHSAGCQVFQNADNFNFFMRLCEMHRKAHGNRFTYTLIDNRQQLKGKVKNGLKIGLITTGLLLTGGLIYNQLTKIKVA